MGADDLGDRVSTISLEYWSNLGGNTTIMEDAAPTLQESVQQNIGVDVEIVPVEFTSQINNVIQDQRTHEMAFWYHTSTPDRLDPQEMTRRYSADWAGGNGQANPANYANCDHTDLAVAQGRAGDPEERRELVYEAQSVMSEDLGSIPIFPTILLGAIRIDEIDPAGIGNGGVARTNPYFYFESTSDLEQVTAVDTPVAMETSNFPVIDSSGAQGIWNHLVHSTLTEYDADLNLQNVLADSVETNSDSSVITVELRDATFHNGDPITAEDVRFTYKQLWDNPGAYPQASSPDYESIEVIDDQTTEFRMGNSFLPLIQKIWPRWGILHKDTWEAGNAPDRPEEFEMDPVIGSGPFAMREFSIGQSMDLTPHDGHPVHSADYDLFLNAYRDEQTAFQALKNNEVQLAPNLSPGTVQQIDENLDDIAETYQTPGIMYFHHYPQTSWSPSQFIEFREAWAASLNRREATDLAVRGGVDPAEYSTPLGPTHPFRPPDDRLRRMAPPEGDPEAAQQALIDAGWGWDDQGRLHYPADKDTSPRWQQGETPDPDEFPCVGEDNSYVAPEEQ